MKYINLIQKKKILEDYEKVSSSRLKSGKREKRYQAYAKNTLNKLKI